METKFHFICLMYLISSMLLATTYQVKQDGTGDFTTIQEGINASVNSDTVLVYPGVYLENIDFEGNIITVASLFITTGNEQYIDQTIVDGNQNGAVVTIENGENENAMLCGFTVTNGSGNPWVANSDFMAGGGVHIRDSSPTIANCHIKFNSVFGMGGGIFLRNSYPILKKVTVANNTARSGGGIELSHDSSIIFSVEEPCNIYSNYASNGTDIRKYWNCADTLYVYVDTFTVMQPDYYFISSSTTTGIQKDDIVMNIQNAVIEPINADLFVSPDGSDSNSGLTPDNPLQTINCAYTSIASDSLHPNTINLMDGVYSNSLNGQQFPFACRAFISLIGESMENTILDAEGSTFLYSANKNRNFSVENITFINGNGIHPNSSRLCYFGNPYQLEDAALSLKNLIFKDNITRVYVISCSDQKLCMSGITFKNNQGGTQLDIRMNLDNIETNIENLVIDNCTQYDHPDVFSATPVSIFGWPYTNNHTVTISNAQITNCIDLDNDWPQSCCGIQFSFEVDVNIVNCTFGDNSTTPSGGVILGGLQGNTINIYNSIFYGDYPKEIYLSNFDPVNPLILNIDNSLVEGGEDNIFIDPEEEEVIVNWNEMSNLEADPLWLGSGDYPYMLSEGSPCIDAGTLDLPAGIELPEFDLAGNPRIFGDTIDMGAYEYQDSTTVEPPLPQPPVRTSITNYPNPFRPSASRSGGTTIMLELVEEGPITVDIYNIKGQKVLNLMDSTTVPGTFKFTWNGTDADNRPVASGQYFVKVVQKGRTTASKMMVIK